MALSFILSLGSKLYFTSSFSRTFSLAAIYSLLASNEVKIDDRAPEVSENISTPPIVMKMQSIRSLVWIA